MKKKIKKIIVFIIIFILIVGIFISPYLLVNIKLIGNQVSELDYGEKYSEPGFKASIFNKDISDKIKVSDNIKKSVGKYEVTYSYNFLFYVIKRTRNITVKDLTGPDIKLKGDLEMSIPVNSKYNEPGFEAIDKLDGDVTKKVKVKDNIDTSKMGTYEVTYEVSDKAGNKSKIVRKVKVDKKLPTQFSLADYTLDGWYEDVKLKKTKDYGDDYFNSITMVGDSNTKNMYQSGVLSGKRAWAIPCLHAESMHTTELNLYGLGTQMKLIDAVEKYKPEIMILNFGTFSSSWISEGVFLDKANAMINEIKEKSPNTKIILISIYPIIEGESINNFKQEYINKTNFLILEMADKHKLKYLDVQEVLKDSDGYGKKEYYSSDKYHLNTIGHKVVKEYIKTHAWEEK